MVSLVAESIPFGDNVMPAANEAPVVETPNIPPGIIPVGNVADISIEGPPIIRSKGPGDQSGIETENEGLDALIG